MAKCLVDQSNTRVINCTPKGTGERASSLLQVMTWGFHVNWCPRQLGRGLALVLCVVS